MLGGIQPGKLQSYVHAAVSGGKGDDGLLQRFGMAVWPDIAGEWKNVDRFPDTESKKQAFEVFLRLDALEPDVDPETMKASPREHRFTEDAQVLFDEWRFDFETDLLKGDRHPALESHFGKYRKLVPALALVCSMADDESEVSEASLCRALAWAKYLASHAERIYTAGTRPATTAAAALLKKIRSGDVLAEFKPADVYLKGWSHLGNPDEVREAAQMLCDLKHLIKVEHGTSAKGGRPSVSFLVNPRTMRGGK
jgi:putative DNA primase/helicase